MLKDAYTGEADALTTLRDNTVNWPKPEAKIVFFLFFPLSGHLMHSHFPLLIGGAQQSEETASLFKINAR